MTSGTKILEALVIVPNEKTSDFGCLLAVARAEARYGAYVNFLGYTQFGRLLNS